MPDNRLRPELQAEVAEFVEAHLRALHRVAYALAGNRPDAEDLVATGITNALPRWEQIRESKFGYVRRSMINIFLNDQRRATSTRELLTADVRTANADLDAEAIAVGLDVHSLLAGLAGIHRAVLVLRFLDDLSASQVGTIIGRPTGTVRRLTHEAIHAIRLAQVPDGSGDKRFGGDR